MKHLDFVAIDFETLTPELTSACSVGLVKVLNGNIFQEYYSLIKPIPDNRTTRNTFIHGITDDMLTDAPTFKDLFPFIITFVDRLPIVCHNQRTDINILYRCMDHYGLYGLNLDNVVDTLDIYNKSLDVCCKENGIIFNNHHNALADAEACAKLYLCSNGVLSHDLTSFNLSDVMNNREARTLCSETLIPLSDEEILNCDTPFFKKKVVITGCFVDYPKRDELGILIKNLGADVNTSISRRTELVLVGSQAGPAKLDKIQKLNAEGAGIRIIYEDELMSMLNDIKY